MSDTLHHVTLREYLDRLFQEADKRYEQRFLAQESATKMALAAAQTAVDKSEGEANRWRMSANEWRAAMSDKDKLFLTRAETIPRLERLDNLYGELKTVRDIASGRASQSQFLLAGAGALVGILVSIVGLFLHLYK